MAGQPLKSGAKLTKKYYMGLPDGVFLVSSVGGFTPFDRDFAESVVPSAGRNAQWQSIHEKRVDGRGCEAFATEEDFKTYQNRWKKTPEGRWVMMPEKT